MFILSMVVLAACNFNTPFSEWGTGSIVLFWMSVGLAVCGIAIALIFAPRIEYTCFMRRAGGDGFWIGKRGPNRAEYESFVATIRDHIGKAAKAA